MNSLRQIEANRRNSLKSTGPTTPAGKGRSSRNAVRHGLSAETVITAVEDIQDYRAFESAVISDYDARTAVERELVLRLASLLWRLRRATSIDTGLLQVHAQRFFANSQTPQPSSSEEGLPLETACAQPGSQHEIARCFLHLASADGSAFERLSRYETALWRQLRQTLFALKLLASPQREVPFARSKHAWSRSVSYP